MKNRFEEIGKAEIQLKCVATKENFADSANRGAQTNQLDIMRTSTVPQRVCVGISLYAEPLKKENADELQTLEGHNEMAANSAIKKE